jgi:hypothetical protein
LSSIFGSCSWAISPLRSGGSNCGVSKRSRRDQAGRRNVKGFCQWGAVAFKRAGDPNVGEFSDAIVLKKFGDVPND